MDKFDASKVYRTTKCFGSWSRNSDGTHYEGAFPNGFMKWVKQMGWWGEKRAYLCAGKVEDPGTTTVDIRPECKPTHLEDARKTTLPNESFDWVMIDPPYSRELAKKLYGTDEHYSSINEFTKEAARICKPGGLILTLTYEIPKRIPGSDFVSVCGVYCIPMTGYMRCFTVSKKKGN
jgi:hypothetical protein